AELRREHLREGCRVALSVVQRAGDDRHVSIRLEADTAHLLVRWRGHFQIAADAEAAQLAALFRVALALFEARYVADLEGAAEYRGEVARVVLHAGRSLVGDLARLDLVALAQTDAVDTHLLRGAVEE